MDLTVPGSAAEVSAAILLGIIALGEMLLCLVLSRWYGKAYFRVWALAWAVYSARLAAILSFILTQNPIWLFWHQVTTGWTALALLWAALVFARRAEWKWRYGLVALFPLVWSYVAIYQLDSFFLAAWPAVLFLSVANFYTAWTFRQHWRRLGSRAGLLLASAFFLWGLHHLDYPILRARGIWNPWGYYVDVVLALTVGTGLLMLVIDDLKRGVRTLSTISNDLQRGDRDDMADRLVQRQLRLGAVSGSALFRMDPDTEPRVVARAGLCETWSDALSETATDASLRVRETGRTELVHQVSGPFEGLDLAHPYLVALPILRGEEVIGSLVIVGSDRDPFAALDEPFLIALGQQMGSALENAALDRALRQRSQELGRLAAGMVRQHEEERARLSRELHDETAQVLAALNFQLAAMQRDCPPDLAEGLRRSRQLLGDGIRSIRTVTEDLRPPLLDELGLVKSLKALVTDFEDQSGLEIHFESRGSGSVPAEGEVALFRALQEGLSNAARHASPQKVDVLLDLNDGGARLVVRDDGRGLPAGADPLTRARQRGGLRGMQERIHALGGELSLAGADEGGVVLNVELPTHTGEPT